MAAYYCPRSPDLSIAVLACSCRIAGYGATVNFMRFRLRIDRCVDLSVKIADRGDLIVPAPARRAEDLKAPRELVTLK